MVLRTKGIGAKENIMAKAFIKTRKELNMMETGLKENMMVSASLPGLMEAGIRVNGETAEKTDRASL